MKTSIFVRTQFEACHAWPEAPAEVPFLRNSHRHVFHVQLEIPVTHDQRQLEFILVKRALTQFLKESIPKESDQSCETMAKSVVHWVFNSYNVTAGVVCSISEDGENGATVRS